MPAENGPRAEAIRDADDLVRASIELGAFLTSFQIDGAVAYRVTKWCTDFSRSAQTAYRDTFKIHYAERAAQHFTEMAAGLRQAALNRYAAKLTDRKC